MSSRIHQLFQPTSVAVVGASSNGEKAGNIVIKNLRTFGYLGLIYPINPNGGEIERLPAYPSLLHCPKPPELAVVAVPHHQVERVVTDAAKAGVRHLIVASGGFADAGPVGKEREQTLLALCRRHGITLMGPNSIGTIDAKFGFCASIGKLPPMPPTGVSLLGQTGTFSTGFALEEITRHGRGFSKIACLGNKGDADEADFLEYYAHDEDTDVIGAYLESVKDGPRFFRVAQEAARRKPLLILKGGRTAAGATAAASHTGGLAGADAVFDGVFRQTGAQRVRDFRELFGALRTLDMCVLPRGPRLGVVSITGVGCVLTADACADHGLTLARISERTQARLQELTPAWATIGNPADIWSTIEQLGAHDAYQRMAAAMIEDEEVDILLVIAVLLEEGQFDSGAALGPVKAAHPGKPILACHLGGYDQLLDSFQSGLERIGVPVFDGAAEAVAAAARLVERAQIVARFARR